MEPYDWEQDEGLPEEAPLGQVHLDPLAQAVEFPEMECAFCPEPVPVYIEGDQIVAMYQIFIHGGMPYLVCADCFELAKSGAPVGRVSSRCGVSVIRA